MNHKILKTPKISFFVMSDVTHIRDVHQSTRFGFVHCIISRKCINKLFKFKTIKNSKISEILLSCVTQLLCVTAQKLFHSSKQNFSYFNKKSAFFPFLSTLKITYNHRLKDQRLGKRSDSIPCSLF
jgi:hypothetical protein